jgi:uncharacterized protein YqjF (DUF2071 family)
MHPLLRETDHRPWPVPRRPWIGRQTWRDLLFAHYRVPTSALRDHVPTVLKLQQENGMSWIGVVPFRMTGVMLRGLPDLPGLSAFSEVNVRVYVEHAGKPGVWFLSLDATNPIAVWTAKRFFNLPYRRARIVIESLAGIQYDYSSELIAAPTTGRFRARYGPTSAIYRATPGSLDHLLTERYCLYALAPSRRLYCTEVHHAPWPLQRATAEVDATDLLASHGIELNGPPEILHFASQIDVLTWAPRECLVDLNVKEP